MTLTARRHSSTQRQRSGAAFFVFQPVGLPAALSFISTVGTPDVPQIEFAVPQIESAKAPSHAIDRLLQPIAEPWGLFKDSAMAQAPHEPTSRAAPSGDPTRRRPRPHRHRLLGEGIRVLFGAVLSDGLFLGIFFTLQYPPTARQPTIMLPEYDLGG